MVQYSHSSRVSHPSLHVPETERLISAGQDKSPSTGKSWLSSCSGKISDSGREVGAAVGGDVGASVGATVGAELSAGSGPSSGGVVAGVAGLQASKIKTSTLHKPSRQTCCARSRFSWFPSWTHFARATDTGRAHVITAPPIPCQLDPATGLCPACSCGRPFLCTSLVLATSLMVFRPLAQAKSVCSFSLSPNLARAFTKRW